MPYGFNVTPDTDALRVGLPNAGALLTQAQQDQAANTKEQYGNLNQAQSYAAAILGTAGMSGNPQLYASAKQHLNGMGIDTSTYSDDPKIGAQQAQLSRLYGATPTAALRSMVMEQEMAQRAGNAVGDPTQFGWAPGIGNGAGLMMPSGVTAQPAAAPAARQPTAAASLQGMAVPAVSDADLAAPQAKGPIPPPPSPSALQAPTQLPNETTAKYQSRLTAWREQNALNPAVQHSVEEGKAGGKATVEGSDELVKTVANDSTMLNTLDEMGDTLGKFQSGALEPAKAQLLRMARAVGYPVSDDDVSKLSNAQVFQKLSMNVLSTAAKNEGQAARLQGAFHALEQANPNWTMEPETLISLRNFMSVPINRDMKELQGWNSAKTQDPNADFPTFQRKFMTDVTQQQTEAGGSLPAFDFKNTPAPMGTKAAVPAAVGQAVMNLQKAGYTQDQINQYLQKKGILNGAGSQ